MCISQPTLGPKGLMPYTDDVGEALSLTEISGDGTIIGLTKSELSLARLES